MNIIIFKQRIYYVEMFKLCIKLMIRKGHMLILIILGSYRGTYQVVRVEGGFYDLICCVKKNCFVSHRNFTLSHE